MAPAEFVKQVELACGGRFRLDVSLIPEQSSVTRQLRSVDLSVTPSSYRDRYGVVSFCNMLRQTPKKCLRQRGMVWKALYGPDGRVLVTLADRDNSDQAEICIWDTSTGEARSGWIRLGRKYGYRDVQISPDGSTLAGLAEKTIRFWLSDSATQVGPTIRHRRQLPCIRFDPSGERILGGCEDKHVYVWDVRTGELICDPVPHSGPVTGLDFSPDGGTLAVQGTMTVQLLRSRSWRPIGGPLAHRLKVVRTAFSPDGATLLTASEDRLIRFWNARTGRPRRIRPLQIGGWIQRVVFSPDGRFLLTGNERTAHKDRVCEAQIWSFPDGAPVGGPIRHDARLVFNALFSPDGRVAVTGGEDGAFKVTSVPDGKLLATLGHTRNCYDAVFNPDGAQLVTCSTDRMVKIWDTSNWNPSEGGGK